VPSLTPNNVDAWLVYSILLTQETNPTTGLVRFDGRLVRDLCDLLGVMEHRHSEVAGKVLYMIGVVNEIRIDALREKQRKLELEARKIRGGPHVRRKK